MAICQPTSVGICRKLSLRPLWKQDFCEDGNLERIQALHILPLIGFARRPVPSNSLRYQSHRKFEWTFK